MSLWQSNLLEHKEVFVCLRKRNWNDANIDDLRVYAEKVLNSIPCESLNPYKMVEMWKNYRPAIPIEYQSDALYAKRSEEVLAKVKVEKEDRSEFRATLKEKKYATKKGIEMTAFDGDEGMA